MGVLETIGSYVGPPLLASLLLGYVVSNELEVEYHHLKYWLKKRQNYKKYLLTYSLAGFLITFLMNIGFFINTNNIQAWETAFVIGLMGKGLVNLPLYNLNKGSITLSMFFKDKEEYFLRMLETEVLIDFNNYFNEKTNKLNDDQIKRVLIDGLPTVINKEDRKAFLLDIEGETKLGIGTLFLKRFGKLWLDEALKQDHIDKTLRK